MKIVSERISGFKSYVTESKDSKDKQYWMSGPTIECDIVNHNERRYKTKVIETALERYFKTHELGKSCFGELDHPADDDPKSTYVNPKEVSHVFHECERDGSVWHTKSFVMDSPNGKIVKSFIDAGAIIGISTRGFGDFNGVEEDNRIIDEVTDYEFITLGDYVTDPSAPNAYLQAIAERKEWVYENGIWKAKEKQIEKHIDKVSKSLNKLSASEIRKESVKFFNEYFDILLRK